MILVICNDIFCMWIVHINRNNVEGQDLNLSECTDRKKITTNPDSASTVAGHKKVLCQSGLLCVQIKCKLCD